MFMFILRLFELIIRAELVPKQQQDLIPRRIHVLAEVAFEVDGAKEPRQEDAKEGHDGSKANDPQHDAAEEPSLRVLLGLGHLGDQQKAAEEPHEEPAEVAKVVDDGEESKQQEDQDLNGLHNDALINYRYIYIYMGVCVYDK
eukprot:GEZU01005514.1.p1 GENE.GEZU01005514.1~~GEZU01005514.1.p1  ORF type:complete len:143 (+),score=21.64 GEZU01005514.1:68-496(+)